MGRVDVNEGRKKRMTLVNTAMIWRLLSIGKVLLGEQLSALEASFFSVKLFRYFVAGIDGNTCVIHRFWHSSRRKVQLKCDTHLSQYLFK
jgi:hypothetical protein